MADKTAIEWTDATWNPITGCSVVSPGCANCYAMRLAGTRLQHHPSRAGLTVESKAGPVWNGIVRLNEVWLTQPLQWRRPRNIFVCAHGDLFHPAVPDAWIDRIFAVMASASWHTLQVLTKRSDRMRAYMADPETIARIGKAQRGLDPEVTCYENVGQDAIWPLPNVWLGVSVEDQRRADERIPDLLATPAAVRFASAEPLLERVDLTDLGGPGSAKSFGAHGFSALRPLCDRPRLDWIIVGGESGSGARPMHPQWARDIRDQCAAAGVPFHFKQWGAWTPHPLVELRHGSTLSEMLGVPRQGWDGCVWRVGKKAAGRLLDGVEHNGMPERAR